MKMRTVVLGLALQIVASSAALVGLASADELPDLALAGVRGAAAPKFMCEGGRCAAVAQCEIIEELDVCMARGGKFSVWPRPDPNGCSGYILTDSLVGCVWHAFHDLDPGTCCSYDEGCWCFGWMNRPEAEPEDSDIIYTKCTPYCP